MSSVSTRGNTPALRSVAFHVARFVQSEATSSTVLVSAILLALLWGAVDFRGYEHFWATPVRFSAGDWEMAGSFREWISAGLMALFFVVVGAEARREFDIGALRERRQLVLPAIAGLSAMALPVLIFLLINQAGGSPKAWGIAMSTDTALALGLLTVVNKRVPERVKAFLLTLFIVDDLVSLLVVAVAYSEAVTIVPLVIGVLLFVAGVLSRRSDATQIFVGPLAVAAWAAIYVSGIDPLIVGLGFGLTASARVPERDRLTGAFESFRQFREQPTTRSAHLAALGAQAALSQNERLQARYQPVASYVIVPLFAFANAGVPISGKSLLSAVTSPVFLGVVLAYVVGKPIAVMAATWLSTRGARNTLQAPVGWAAIAGTGTIAGVGFTVSILIAALVFEGRQLYDAKVAVIAAALIATIETWIVYRLIALLPANRRISAVLGRTTVQLDDLTVPVEPERDHVRGLGNAVTLVEYGDFECPYCGRAEPEVRAVLGDEDVQFVWRHLPIMEVHPHALLAAEASEAAAAQGAFWQMHDLLLAHQHALTIQDLERYAEALRLDTARFLTEVRNHTYRERVAEDARSAEASGVAGTPTFFINGQRHYGAFDARSLREAVVTARETATLTPR